MAFPFLNGLWTTLIRFGSATGPLDIAGAGSPEGVVTAPVGSTYRRTNGGIGTTFYSKESGVGNTGWVAMAAGGGGGSSDPLNLLVTNPAQPTGSEVRVHRVDHSGRQMPGFKSLYERETTVQPFLASNKIARYNPGGNSPAQPAVDGFASAFTSTGTLTARSVATTNQRTRLKRIGSVSAATVGALAGLHHTIAQWTTGDGTGLGGFHYVWRFMVSDAAVVAAARMFVGMSNLTSALTNVEPSTLQNCIGVCQISTSDNLHVITNGSSGSATLVDLGVAWRATGLSANAYELQIFSSNIAAGIIWQVKNIITDAVVQGVVAGGNPATLPPATVLLAPRSWRCNNTTALAVGLDTIQGYIETGN